TGMIDVSSCDASPANEDFPRGFVVDRLQLGIQNVQSRVGEGMSDRYRSGFSGVFNVVRRRFESRDTHRRFRRAIVIQDPARRYIQKLTGESPVPSLAADDEPKARQRFREIFTRPV